MSSMFLGYMFSPSAAEAQDSEAAMSEGDPWEGCDDIAGEDLADFLSHQLQLKDASCFKSSLESSLPSTRCSTPRMSEDGRPSVGSLSVASSSDFAFDLELSCSARSSVNCLPPSPGFFGCEPAVMEPLVEEDGEDDWENVFLSSSPKEEELFQGGGDWEAEFMLRNSLDAPASARQLKQIEVLAAETEVADPGDRCVAMMAECRARC